MSSPVRPATPTEKEIGRLRRTLAPIEWSGNKVPERLRRVALRISDGYTNATTAWLFDVHESRIVKWRSQARNRHHTPT